MSYPPVRITPYVVQGLVLLLGLLVASPLLQPAYGNIVLGIAQVFLEVASPLMHVQPEPDGGWHVMVSQSASNPSWAFIMGNDLFSRRALISLVLVPALILTTPARLKERTRLLLVAIPLVLIIDAVSMAAVFYVTGISCYGNIKGSSCRQLAGLLAPWGQVTGVSIWALLTWRRWLAVLGVASSRKRA